MISMDDILRVLGHEIDTIADTVTAQSTDVRG